MPRPTDGARPELIARCPNCRTTGTHRLIRVTEALSLISCDHCWVSRVHEPRPEAPAAPPPRPQGAAIMSAFLVPGGPRLVSRDGVRVDGRFPVRP